MSTSVKGLVALVGVALAATPALASTICWDLRGPERRYADGVAVNFTGNDAVSQLQVTAQQRTNNVWVAAGVFTTPGVDGGVGAASTTDTNPGQLDSIGNDERLRFDFLGTTRKLKSITFTLADSDDDVDLVISSLNFSQTFSLAAHTNGIFVLNLGHLNLNTSTFFLRAFRTTNPEEPRNDDFRIQEVCTIPLPPAAWAGIGTLAGVAGIGVIRRRKIAEV